MLQFDVTSFRKKKTPVTIHRLWYTPSAVLKIKDSSTAPGHMVFPQSPQNLSAKQHQICFQTASFSMELSDWLARTVRVAVAEPVPVNTSTEEIVHYISP